MKNTQICKSCGTENPFYVTTCKNCSFYLRDKIVNIDLWNVIGRLIENPKNAFITIIQSEHKNFVVSIILFAAIKFSIDVAFLLMLEDRGDTGSLNIFSNTLIIIAILVAVLFLYSFLVKIITQKTEAKTRLKDNLAVLSYSLIPHAMALCIIFPIEIVVFGGNIFSSNPSPFILKPMLAYILSGFEILILLWSILLGIIGMYTQSRSITFGFIAGVLFNVLLFGGYYILSLIR